MATQASIDAVQKAYIAFYGRPADPTGLTYWADKLDQDGGSFDSLIDAFGNSAEATSLYGSLDSVAKVNALYNQILGRDADVDGLTYYANKLTSGEFSAASIAQRIFDGATGDDATVLVNKLAVAKAFTAALDTAAEIINYAGDASAASARTMLDTVTATTDTATFDVDTTISGLEGVANPGSTFTLTTSIDAVSGAAGDDVISGYVGASGTYTVGDNIMGNSGSDTLNLIDAGSATSVGLVSMDGVETVNVRMISAGTTVLNANDWSGVATLSNVSSVAESTLTVSGVEVSTDITASMNGDINIQYRDVATGHAATMSLVNAGSDSTATSLGSASGNALATVDLDKENAGLLGSVSVDLSGTNFAALEFGAGATAATLTGNGTSYLQTDDTLTSFDASAVTGNTDVTFNGASNITVTMGSGDDKVRLGSNLSNSDSVDGGDGSDTVFAQVNGFSRSLNTTNVETATLTFGANAGGTVNATGSTVTTVNVFASGTTNDANIAGLDAGTINLVDDTIDAVTVGYQSGSVTMNVGSASGTVAVGAITVSGADTFSLVGNGGTAGAGSVGAVDVQGATTVSVATNGTESDISGITDFSAAAATSFTVTSQNSGAITFTSAMGVATALETVSISAVGSGAGVTMGALFDGGVASSISQITLAATDADITVGAITLGNGGVTAAATDLTLTLNAGADANVGTTAMDIASTGDINITIDIDADAASADVTVGDVDMTAGTAGTGQLLTIDAFTIGTAGTVELVEEAVFTGSGSQVVVGDVTVGKDATFTIFGSGGFSAANIEAVDVSKITVNVGASGNAFIGGATGSQMMLSSGGAFGGIEATIANAGTAVVGTVAASSVGAITVDVDGEGAFMMGAIDASGGTVDDITLNVEASGSAMFNTINASAIGSITVSGAGVVGGLDLSSAGSVGTIDTTGQVSGASFTINLDGLAAAAEINLGVGTNSVTSGGGNDVITLTAGRTAVAGNDTIVYTASGQGNDNIINFIAGAAASGGDQIDLDQSALGAAGIQAGNGSAAGSVAIQDLEGGATSMAATTTVLRYTTAIASETDLISAMKGDITLAASASAASFLELWSDGNGDTYVSVVDYASKGASHELTLGSASAMSVTTLATLDGITPGAIVAANLDFI